MSVIETALTSARDQDTPTSVLVEDAIRVARLIGDYVSLTWLELEMRHVVQKFEKLDVSWELVQGLGEEQAKAVHLTAREHYIEERTIPSALSGLILGEGDKIDPSSVLEIEAKIRQNAEAISRLDENLLAVAQLRVSQEAMQTVLARVRSRVIRYLTREERVLGLSDDADAMFDEFRAETDIRLGEACPDALGKFSAACRALMRQEPESATHALTSCRRLMKAVADALYPASDDVVIGADGEPHDTDEESYINRLVQWVSANQPRSKERAVLVDTLRELHARLRKLDDLSSKGVHGEVRHREVRFGLIQTYLTMGEVARLAKRSEEID